MAYKLGWLLVVLGGGVACASAQQDSAFVPTRDFILTKSGAVGLLPPIPVCSFAPEKAVWSDDGERLLVVQRNPRLSETKLVQNLISNQGERSVVIFDTKTRKSREVLSYPESQGAVVDTGWFGNGQDYFLVTRTGTKDAPPGEVRSRLYLGNAVTGRTTLAYTGQPGERISFCPSPKEGLGAMVVSRFVLLYQPFSSWGQIVFADGRLGAVLETPENASFRFREEAYWSGDGNVVVLPFLGGTPGAPVSLVPIDSSSGKKTHPPQSRYQTRIFDPEFGVWEIKEKRSAEEVSVEGTSLWLVSLIRGPRSRAFIVGDGRDASISPSRRAMFYVAGGVGVVRPLVSISREEFAQLHATEEKNGLTADLRECIKVFNEWVVDEDQVFPTPEEFALKAKAWSAARPELVGFVYTFKGGLISAGRRAQTMFGYKQGETGRATCYMDGRVVWTPN